MERPPRVIILDDIPIETFEGKTEEEAIAIVEAAKLRALERDDGEKRFH